ncbi:hypothetical protein LJC01_01995 [Clostridiaceae bacterium OttesenSCG-928-D20]|nr:hypothetical protein [Clostridiaceae bacterium OttesenSCG-928-D20]
MMNTKENRPTALTVERKETSIQTTRLSAQVDSSTKPHYLSSVTPDKEAFFLSKSFIPVGEENAITTKNLLKISKMGNIRSLRQKIEQERKAGAVILSTRQNGGGYFLPSPGEKGRQEMQSHIRTIYSQIKNMVDSTHSTKQALNIPEEQIDFFERY